MTSLIRGECSGSIALIHGVIDGMYVVSESHTVLERAFLSSSCSSSTAPPQESRIYPGKDKG